MRGENLVQVGIIGGSGYVGLELLRLLATHSKVQVRAISSREHAGKGIGQVHPSLNGIYEMPFSPPEFDYSELDCVLVSVPHTQSKEIVHEIAQSLPFRAGDLKIIDLGGDLRLSSEALYGLPEAWPEKIKAARIIANPGCFAHCIILALLPLLQQESLIESPVRVSAITGSSGSGAQVSLKTHHPERNESVAAYSVLSHRHVPEIERALSAISSEGTRLKIELVPISGPYTRGIFATVFVKLKHSLPIIKLYQEYSQSAPFIRLRNETPSLLAVRGSNFCDLAVHQNGTEVVILSALDNLVKGAAGNAIQCLNLMYGSDAHEGLLHPSIYP